ncbi:MAG: hypothetical protein ACFFC7_21155 [Candidatus Hermodarchaeota archaeon]
MILTFVLFLIIRSDFQALNLDYEDEGWEGINGYEYDQQQAMRKQAKDRQKNINLVIGQIVGEEAEA